jgi:hypothetical protein
MRRFLGAFQVTALVVVQLVLQAALHATPAHACKCAPPPSVSDALHAATAVFEGRVTAISEEPAQDGQPSQRWVVHLHTVRAWKGVEVEDLVVLTAKDSAACGYPFANGESYLVYAEGEPSQLSVATCGRTMPIVQAEADLAALGMGVVPVNPNQPDAGPHPSRADQVIKPALPAGEGGCASCSLGQRRRESRLAAWPSLALGLALVLRRRRERSTRRSSAH